MNELFLFRPYFADTPMMLVSLVLLGTLGCHDVKNKFINAADVKEITIRLKNTDEKYVIKEKKEIECFVNNVINNSSRHVVKFRSHILLDIHYYSGASENIYSDGLNFRIQGKASRFNQDIHRVIPKCDLNFNLSNARPASSKSSTDLHQMYFDTSP